MHWRKVKKYIYGLRPF